MMSSAGPLASWTLRQAGNRFYRRTERFRAISDRTLEQILKLNGCTEYGQQRGLDGPSPRRVFDSLPATTYADYIPYVQRIAAGEQNILTAEPVIFFSTTSGTTGPPKLIPVTQRKMRMTGMCLATGIGMAIRAGVLKPMRGPFLTIMTEHVSGTTAGGVPKGSATTGGYKRMGKIADLIFSSPPEVARVADQTAARYLHLLFALSERNLWTIVAFFPATLLFALRDLHHSVDSLLRDLAEGTISRDLDISAQTRLALQQRLAAEPARARELLALLEQDRFTVGNIWRDMGSILTVTGGAFRFYADQLQPFLGSARVFSPIYSASEGTFGFGYSAENPYYLLLPVLNYVELLPVEAAADPQCLPIPAWQAEPGRKYEVVVTTFDGLVRYRLQDIVRVIGFEGQTPVIEFIERCGQVIDIVGEKTAEHHVVEAIAAASRSMDEPLVDYFVAPDTETTPARYVLAIEEWRGEPTTHERAVEFVRLLETDLRRTAADYDEERALGTLGPMGLVLLRRGAFERLRRQRIAAGSSASQVKTPHIVIDPGFLAREFASEILVRMESHEA